MRNHPPDRGVQSAHHAAVAASAARGRFDFFQEITMALRTSFLLACGTLLALSGCAVAPPGAYVTGTTVYEGVPVAVPDPYGYGYGYGGYGGYGYGGLGYSRIYGGPAYYGGSPGYYGGPRYGGPRFVGPPPRPPGPPPGFGGPRPGVAPLGTMPPPRYGGSPRMGPPAGQAGPGGRSGPPMRFVPRGGGLR